MSWSQFSAIFANFLQKLTFFSKNNVMIIFLQKKLAVVLTRFNNIFTNFFGENIFKNYNIGPRATHFAVLAT
jgi:hypothetical protein